jgi:2-polyprenyl-6-methoxyphenol hydroxylase-like FAD-dependent oxidoreductase
MHGLAVIATWTAFGAGLLVLADGVTSLVRRQVVLPWMRQRIEWQRFGWSQVLLSTFILLETVPRLANVSSGVVLAISVVAFVPVLAAGIVQMRAQRPGS